MGKRVPATLRWWLPIWLIIYSQTSHQHCIVKKHATTLQYHPYRQWGLLSTTSMSIGWHGIVNWKFCTNFWKHYTRTTTKITTYRGFCIYSKAGSFAELLISYWCVKRINASAKMSYNYKVTGPGHFWSLDISDRHMTKTTSVTVSFHVSCHVSCLVSTPYLVILSSIRLFMSLVYLHSIHFFHSILSGLVYYCCWVISWLWVTEANTTATAMFSPLLGTWLMNGCFLSNFLQYRPALGLVQMETTAYTAWL